MQSSNLNQFMWILLACFSLGCQSESTSSNSPAPETAVTDSEEASAFAALQDDQTVEVEAACGECQFGMPGSGCDLAVRYKGETLFVAGTGIDDHGDAHAADGFCNAIKKATVRGHVEDGKFHVTDFQLVDAGDSNDTSDTE